MRYTSYTIDGSAIHTSDTAAGIIDAVLDHTLAGKRPHVAYMHDSAPDQVWPFTTMRLGDGAPVASIVTPWKTFAEIPLHLLKVE